MPSVPLIYETDVRYAKCQENVVTVVLSENGDIKIRFLMTVEGARKLSSMLAEAVA